MSPLWCLVCFTVIFANFCLVEGGKKSQEDVIVINNGGSGGGCGGGAKTIVKTSGGGKKKGKGKGGHKIILTSGGGKCHKEHKVHNIPIPIPIPQYEHHHHEGGWGGEMDKRSLASNRIEATAMPLNDKGDRGNVMPVPMAYPHVGPFGHHHQHRMDMGYPVPFFNQYPFGVHQMPFV